MILSDIPQYPQPFYSWFQHQAAMGSPSDMSGYIGYGTGFFDTVAGGERSFTQYGVCYGRRRRGFGCQYLL
jgi:hypothetical protein